MYKNKKRLATLAITFLFVFIIGAAFAAGPGELDVTGMVGVVPQEPWVIWTDATTTPNADVAAISAATIVAAAPVNQTTYQKTVEWDIGFVAAGSVDLAVTATNVGDIAAVIDDVSVLVPVHAESGITAVVVDEGTVLPTDTLAANPDAYPTVGATAGTADFVIRVTWDGVGLGEDEAFGDGDDPWFAAADAYVFNTTFTLTFAYSAA